MLSRTALGEEHSVLAAQDLPAGADLEITKTIQNETAPVILEDDGDPVAPPIPFTDTLTYGAGRRERRPSRTSTRPPGHRSTAATGMSRGSAPAGGDRMPIAGFRARRPLSGR